MLRLLSNSFRIDLSSDRVSVTLFFHMSLSSASSSLLNRPFSVDSFQLNPHLIIYNLYAVISECMSSIIRDVYIKVYAQQVEVQA